MLVQNLRLHKLAVIQAITSSYPLPALRTQYKQFQYRCNSSVSGAEADFTASVPTAAEDKLNAVSTLPASLLSRKEIFSRIQKEQEEKNRGVHKSYTVKKWFGFAKEILKFYKAGLSNVWKNQKTKKSLLNEKYYVDLINYTSKERVATSISSGQLSAPIVKGKIKNSKDLTNYLLSEIYIGKVQDKARESDSSTSVDKKSKDSAEVEKENLTNITRSEYQLILRTEKDFPKLPLFAIIFLIFEELTPLICYLIPQLIPSTCTLPNILKKQELKKIGLLSQSVPAIAPASAATSTQQKTVTISESGAELVHEFFVKPGKIHECTPQELKFLYKFFISNSGISALLTTSNYQTQRLVALRNEILVDNHLILQNGGFENLNTIELILCANSRGLIDVHEHDGGAIIDIEKFKDGDNYDGGINKVLLLDTLNKFAKETEFAV